MPGPTSSGDRSPSWTGRLVRSLLFWILPAAVVWLLLTPFYNRFLSVAGEQLARLTEFPGVTRLYICLLYTSPSPRDGLLSRMPSSA